MVDYKISCNYKNLEFIYLINYISSLKKKICSDNSRKLLLIHMTMGLSTSFLARKMEIIIYT